nr:MAG TPA: hypothetical protein [Caudoviricetes sp.]
MTAQKNFLRGGLRQRKGGCYNRGNERGAWRLGGRP